MISRQQSTNSAHPDRSVSIGKEPTGRASWETFDREEGDLFHETSKGNQIR